MAKYLAQLIITGAQIVGRAFTKAVREELKTSSHASQRRGDTAASRQSANTDLKHGISLEEAMQILNIDKNSDKAALEEKYKHLFEANEKSKGGSFYLQSKVFRAKERLDEELSGTNESSPESDKKLDKEG